MGAGMYMERLRSGCDSQIAILEKAIIIVFPQQIPLIREGVSKGSLAVLRIYERKSSRNNG